MLGNGYNTLNLNPDRLENSRNERRNAEFVCDVNFFVDAGPSHHHCSKYWEMRRGEATLCGIDQCLGRLIAYYARARKNAATFFVRYIQLNVLVASFSRCLLAPLP